MSAAYVYHLMHAVALDVARALQVGVVVVANIGRRRDRWHYSRHHPYFCHFVHHRHRHCSRRRHRFRHCPSFVRHRNTQGAVPCVRQRVCVICVTLNHKQHAII